MPHLNYLNELKKTDTHLKPSLAAFTTRLKEAFNYFEEKKQLPVIMINRNGEYVVH